MDFEYKVIAAPKRMRKVKGITGATELFAHTLGETINQQAAEGWEYLRADVMLAEEPRGIFRAGATSEHTVLVFRRARGAQRRANVPEMGRMPPREAELPNDQPVAGPSHRAPQQLQHETREAGPLRPGPRLGPANES